MSPLARIALPVLPALAVALGATVVDQPALACGALAAAVIVLAAAALAPRAHGTRAVLVATLLALGVRLLGAVAGAVLLTLAFAAAAPAAIAVLGLCLVAGLVVDTCAAWRAAASDREPLHA